MIDRLGRRARALLIGCLAVLMLLLSVATVGAADVADPTAQLSIKPAGVEGSYFALRMAPGETRDLTIELKNSGTVPARALTYPADAFTLVNGGFGARSEDEPISGTTRWIDYRAETLDLAPNASVRRTFQLTIPADAKPGEYLTSLVIQNAAPLAAESHGGIALDRIIRQVIAVSIDIPGPRTPALAIGGVSHKTAAGKSLISFDVENTGNVRLKPAGEFVLTDATGAELARAPIEMSSVYAATETSAQIPLDRLLDPDDYIASLSLKDATTGVQASSGPLRFTVTKPAEVGPGGVAGSTSGDVSVTQQTLDRVTGGASLPVLLVVVGAIGAALLAIVAGFRLRRRTRPGVPDVSSRRLAQVTSAPRVRPTPRGQASPVGRPVSREAEKSPAAVGSGEPSAARPSTPIRRLTPPS